LSSANTVARTVSIMIAATLFSKVLGMLRSVTIAALYGTGMEGVAILTASRIPLLFFDATLGAAILSCFIPVYSGFSTEHSRMEGDRFAANFATFILIITVGMSVVGSIFAQPIVSVVQPGLAPHVQQLAASLTAIMFPMIVFTGIAFTFVGILQSNRQFIGPSLISAISNGVIILYLLVVGKRLPVQGVGVAYLVAWMSQVLFLLPFLKKIGYRHALRLVPVHPGMKQIVRMVIPVLVSSWVQPAISFLNIHFVSYVDSSGQASSALDYANQLYLIAAGVLTYGVTNYLFPHISENFAKGEKGLACTSVRTSLSSLLMILMPIMAAFTALAPEIVTVIYKRSAFVEQDVILTSSAMAVFALGMIGFGLMEVMNRTFFAMKSTRLPMVAALAGIAVNALLSFLFVQVYGMGIAAIAGAGAIGQTVTGLLLCVFAQTKLPLFQRSFFRKLVLIIGAGILCYLCMMALRTGLAVTGLTADGFFDSLVRAIASFAPAVAVYLVVLRLFRVDEAVQFLKDLKKRPGK
jgi:putative peptidoglycan lipid II flippase